MKPTTILELFNPQQKTCDDCGSIVAMQWEESADELLKMHGVAMAYGTCLVCGNRIASAWGAPEAVGAFLDNAHAHGGCGVQWEADDPPTNDSS